MTTKSVLFLAISILFCTRIDAQQLIFCERISADGKAQGVSNSFIVKKEGGYVNIMYYDEDNFNTDSLHFEFYLNGIYFYNISSEVKKDWDYFYHTLNFREPGVYTVYVLDDKRRELVFDKLNITVK